MITLSEKRDVHVTRKMPNRKHPLRHALVVCPARWEHTFSGMEITKRLSSTIANMARYAVDFSRFDDSPLLTPLSKYLSYELQRGLTWLLSEFEIDMVSSPTRVRYHIDPNWFGLSYFGPIGPLLMYPAIAIGVVRRRDALFWAFALASLCFLVAQAAGGPYDPWRGRLFTGMLLFAAPAAALVAGAPTRHVSVALVSLSLTIAVLSGLYSVINPINSNLPAILSMSRVAQLTREKLAVREAVENYERIVPPDSQVLSILDPDSYEFPFFGEKLNRHLIPGGNWQQMNDFPRYILFNKNLLPKDCDFVLGAGYRLRDTEICPYAPSFR